MESAQEASENIVKEEEDVSVEKELSKAEGDNIEKEINEEEIKEKEIKEIKTTDETATKNKDEKVKGDLSSTVAKHYNELEELGLASREKSRIFYLRNFNNWIKSVLIANTLRKIQDGRGDHHKTVVLDLCSGKGGDLLKWKNGRVNKVTFVDIAETSVEQSKVRYQEMQKKNQNSRYRQHLFSADFLTADVTKKRLKEMYADSVMFDLVSCQFAFHYSFESYPQAEMMLKNVSESLRPGGYFIGTVPNAYELVHRIRAVEGDSFGNEVYNIEFENKDKENFPLFGAQYRFHLEGVVDCPEFLVYFPVLEKMAKKHGLELSFKKPFADYFDENARTSERLLGSMQALESYPAVDGAKLMSSNKDDYAFAKTAFDKASSSGRYKDSRHPLKVGTISKAEWEAISLYLVFVFQKVKDETKKRKSEDKLQSSPEKQRKNNEDLEKNLSDETIETKIKDDNQESSTEERIQENQDLEKD